MEDPLRIDVCTSYGSHSEPDVKPFFGLAPQAFLRASSLVSDQDLEGCKIPLRAQMAAIQSTNEQVKKMSISLAACNS